MTVTAATDTETIQPERMKDVGDTEMMGASTAHTVPLFHYCYLTQAYRKHLEAIEKTFGVQIKAETRVFISAEEADKECDSVLRATQAFSELYQEATKNLKTISVRQTHLKSDIMKNIISHNIPNEQNKIMLSMSANSCLLFGPERITSVVEKQIYLENGVDPARSFGHKEPQGSETDAKHWGTSGSWTSMQTSQPLDMDIRDTQDRVEMDTAHWQLIKVVFEKQVSEIEDKYGVQFDADCVQDVTKVSARCRAAHQVNLEAHALRAFTHLYQKVATSAVICGLKDASYTEIVRRTLEESRSRNTCVGGGERNGSWELFGLPKHLVPAIADIEKIIGHGVFDDNTKKLLGYPWRFPQASGLQRGRMGVDVMGEYGTDWKDGVEAKKFGFNQDPSREVKEDAEKKGSDDSEEDKCPICLDTFTQKKKLKCSHEFCTECLERSIKCGGEICPICKKIFGTLRGNQPDGRMEVHHKPYNLSGFTGFGTIEITYRIQSGTQTVR